MKKIILPLVLILVLLSSTIAFAAGSLNLPNYPVSVSYSSWGSSTLGMFNATLSGVGAGFDVTDGTYGSWCVQKEIFADVGTVTLYSSDDNALPADAAGFAWDKVNYLMNHKSGTAWDVQQALWVVLGQEVLANVTPAAAAMAQDALANGAAFVPAPGQIIVVLLYSDGFGGPNDYAQETIIELQVPGRDGPGTGTPGYWKNHPEAWPVNSITIGEDTITKEQAIAFMGLDGDKSYTMFRAYVAAYLNGLVGNDTSCVTSELTNAYNWLNVYEPGSGVTGKSAAWKVGEPIATKLDNYNNGLLCAPHRD